MKPERNDPCPCGSGKVFEKCCQEWYEAATPKSAVKKMAPTATECSQLVALLNAGRLTELENRTRLLLEQYPESGVAWNLLGASLQMQGKDGLFALQNATEFLPNDAEAHGNLGNALSDLGRLNEAEASYRRALQINPNNANVHGNLGITLNDLGRLDEAEACYRRALRIKPDIAEIHISLGNTLRKLGRLGEAEASYRQALRIKPGIAEAHISLGNTLQELGRLDEAEASYRRVLELKPDFAGAHYNLGVILHDLGRLVEAEASYRRALEIKLDYAEAHGNLGVTLHDMGRLDEAEASYRRALEIKPDAAAVHYNFGITQKGLGLLDDAMASYRRALEIKPDFAEAYNNIGSILRSLGQLDGAVENYRRALEIKPGLAEVHNNLGNILRDIGQLDDAVASCRRALEINPDYVEAHGSLGNALQDLGQLDDAVACYRRALEIKPDYAEGRSNLLFCLTHVTTVDAETLFAEHRRFGEQFEANFSADYPQHANSRNPERPLRIGFVSGDLRNHSVACFIEPILACLSGNPQLSLHAYSNYATEDAVTQRIRKHFMHWDFIVGLSDADLAEKIRADSIDILIDLSGHTAKNRLLTFVRKPAPVQASWIGYLGTTGLKSMDYYLADRFFLPDEKFRAQFTEKIVYLPAIVPFMPSKEAPLVNALPALSNGYVTFGSFNSLSKQNLPVVALWSQLLRALPESRMLLGAMPHNGFNALIDWFAQEGIAQERLSFHPRCGLRDYLALHHQVDICLDTFPYSGATTTNYALWMGVPTLTMPGSTPTSRIGATYMSHAGLEEFIAQDAEDFVKKGMNWAKDIEALARLRAGLRGRFEQSALGQSALIAESLERALRIMWKRWCAGLPAESFEINPQVISSA